MRNVLLTFFAALLLLAGCGKPKAVLNVYNWSEYVDPALITQFEKENNCHVVIDIFNSNEAMLAKIDRGAVRAAMSASGCFFFTPPLHAEVQRQLGLLGAWEA